MAREGISSDSKIEKIAGIPGVATPNLNDNLQGSYGAIRKWVGRPDYGHGAASRALKTSREPASAKEAGRSFHSLTVLKTN